MAISNREAGWCAGEWANGARNKIYFKSFLQSHLDTIEWNSRLTGTGGTTNRLPPPALVSLPKALRRSFSVRNGYDGRGFGGSARIEALRSMGL